VYSRTRVVIVGKEGLVFVTKRGSFSRREISGRWRIVLVQREYF